MASGTIIICEKPSQAKNIYRAIGNSYGQIKPLAGHVIRLEKPEENNPDYAVWKDRVLIPNGGKYKYKIYENKISLFKEAKTLISNASEVIIATDCDREGQAIGQELLEVLDFKGKVWRAMFSAEDPKTLKKAFQNLKPNSEYKNLYDAAIARSQTDQIYNLSLTGSATYLLKKTRDKKPIGIGRVKTPTLFMVCKRWIDIKNFKPQTYYEIEAIITNGKENGSLWHRPKSEDKRITDENKLKTITELTKKYNGPIKVENNQKKEPPYRPHSGTTIEKVASNIGLKSALDVTQKLYETNTITTYPRAETQYLPENLIPNAQPILDELFKITEFKHLLNKGFGKAFIRKGGKWAIFSDEGMGASPHHAIIPNINCTNGIYEESKNLIGKEREIFLAIARNYIIATGPEHIYNETIMSINIENNKENYDFSARGIIVVENGWKNIFDKSEEKEDDNTKLPNIKDKEIVKVEKVNSFKKVTKPQKLFSRGELIADEMAKAYKYIENKEEQEKLKESKGIGQPSTINLIVDGLVKQEFIEIKTSGTIIAGDGSKISLKNKVIPTEKGLELYEILNSACPEIMDPGETARMEFRCDSILKGQANSDQIIKEVIKITEERIEKLRIAARSNLSIGGSSSNKPSDKMINFAKIIAKNKNITLNNEILTDFNKCKEFIQENAEIKSKEDLIKEAQELSKNYNKKLTSEIIENDIKLKEYIKDAKGKSIKATEKQIETIKKMISKGEKEPNGFPDISIKEAAEFISKVINKINKSKAKNNNTNTEKPKK